MFLIETMVSDSNYQLLTILNFKGSSPWQSYAWSYVLISIPFTTLLLGELPFLLGGLWIITWGLVIHTYILMVKILLLRFMIVRFGKLPHLYGKFSIFPGSSLVRTYFWSSTSFYKSFIMIFMVGFYPFWDNKCLLFYHLLPHLYHPVWLVIFFNS